MVPLHAKAEEPFCFALCEASLPVLLAPGCLRFFSANGQTWHATRGGKVQPQLVESCVPAVRVVAPEPSRCCIKGLRRLLLVVGVAQRLPLPVVMDNSLPLADSNANNHDVLRRRETL